MRAILFAFAWLLLVIPASAQSLGTESKTFTGVIERSVHVRPGPPLYTIAKIDITADNGEKLVCFILHDTKFTGADGAVQDAARPTEGKRVEIQYLAIIGGSGPLENGNAATTLKYLN